MAGMTVSDMWEMLDLITPMAVRVAATLRVADLIEAGHDRIESLARAAGVDRDALARLLRYLAARGLFHELAPGRFALTDGARMLLDTHPSATRRWIDLEGFGGRMDLAFFDLLATVRTGRPPAPIQKDEMAPEIATSYDTVMEAQSRRQAPIILAAHDWSDARHIADIGGGTGTLLAAILHARPDARGTLLELPATAAAAERTLAGERLADRATVIAGDLFELMPRGADIYILKFILHFLDDEQAVTALRRCREAGHENSRVLVIETTVAPGDETDSFTAMDLRMLILGHGRERTLAEYTTLAARAGLLVASTTPTSAGPHVIALRISA